MIASTASETYNLRVIWLSLLYGAFLMARRLRLQAPAAGRPVAYLAAVLPALPIIGIFAAIGRYLVEEQDEYLRMLMVRQTLWASAFALSVATVWGFLESFDMVGHVEAYYVAVLWFGGLGLGACINKLTLGAPVGC